MNFSRQAISRVLNKVSQNLTVATALTDYKPVTSTLARVIVSASTKASSADLRQALARTFSNKASPVAGSFRAIESAGAATYYGFVRLNRTVKPYDDAGKMRQLASNLLMDSTDQSLWQITAGPNGQKMLARKTNDDLSQLLQTAKVLAMRTPVLANVAVEPAVREFAAFVDPNTESLRFGYILASRTVEGASVVDILPNVRLDGFYGETASETDGNQDVTLNEQRDQEPVTVDVAMIVESAFVEEADAETFQIEVPEGSGADKLKFYFRKLYDAYTTDHEKAAEYYNMLAEAIDQHAAIR